MQEISGSNGGVHYANIGHAILRDYNSFEALQSAAEQYRSSLSSTLNHFSKVEVAGRLAEALFQYYQIQGTTEFLDEAIEKGQTVVDGTPEPAQRSRPRKRLGPVQDHPTKPCLY